MACQKLAQTSRNLDYMRAFAEAWPDDELVQAVLSQLPWYHQFALLDKLNSHDSRRWYAEEAITHNWSRNILVMQIESRLLERSGTALTNLETTLPELQSDLARESLKDSSRFDFLCLTEEAQEREIEHALVKHVTEFSLELGCIFRRLWMYLIATRAQVLFRPEFGLKIPA